MQGAAFFGGAMQQPGFGAKRTGPSIIGPSTKAPRTGGPPEGDGWLCDKCGNHNFDTRTYCNMRKCGAPGPWSCPACGNRNFANRSVCNMRSCGQPRPPPTGGNAPGMAGGMMGPAAAGVNQQAALQALAMLQASGLGHIPGVQEGISKIVASTGIPAAGGKGRQPQQFQEGSWVCLGCGNINFPNRTGSCNAKMCGRPRQEVDGGPPKAGASTKSIFMPGSWVCNACQNINWPKRESCGMRSCGRARAEVDAGPPSPAMLQAQLESQGAIQPPMQEGGGGGGPGLGGGYSNLADPANGAWNCPHCNNLNFAGREVCNKRSCGRPRFS